jgi:hypothetical protein
MSREAPCGSEDARTRSRVARTYLNLAETASATRESEARNAAAGNAVIAAIAASDALCCRQLGRRSREQDHSAAAPLLAKITPGGPKLARDLTSVLAIKDTAHYGITFLTEAKLKAALRSVPDSSRRRSRCLRDWLGIRVGQTTELRR